MTMRVLLLPALGLLLAGCQSPLPPTPPAEPTAVDAIEGRIAPRSPVPDAVGYPMIVGLPSGTVPVQADGTFRLPLPSLGTTFESYLGEDCTGTATDSNPAARFQELSGLTLRLWKDGTVFASVKTVRTTSAGREEYVYIYATAPVRIAGTSVCPVKGSPFTTTEFFSLNFAQGWNLVKFTRTAAGPLSWESVSPTVVSWE